MAKNRNLVKELYTDADYCTIGLDLAKNDVSIAAIACDDTTPTLIDRMTYDELYALADKLSPTLFAFEPCCAYSHVAAELQIRGHQVRVISGRAVKNWINTHMSGQKTDLNDALALARLASDPDLQPIRPKTVEERRIMTLQGIRLQYVSQKTQTLVSFKGFCQSWGIPLRACSKNLKKFEDILKGNVELLSENVVAGMLSMLDRVRDLNAKITEIDKTLTELVSADLRGALLLDVLGVGTQIAARFLTTIGDIERFDSPRSAVAYVGLAPKNNITGHINKPKPRKSGLPDTRYKGQGRVSKHGDTYLRTLLTQGAASIYMLHSRKALEQCPLKCWLEKQLNNGKPYGKIIISLAAKLVRIMWALLTYGEEFDLHKAGVSRAMLAKMSAEPSAQGATAS